MQVSEHVDCVGVVTVDGHPIAPIGCTQMKGRADGERLIEKDKVLWTFSG